MRHTWALSQIRMRLALRNRAFIFFSVVMPLMFLFLYFLVFGKAGTRSIPYLLAAVLALTIMGSFWGLSLQLVMFREQGILRRFRLSPVDASALLASSIVSNYFLTLPIILLEFAIARWGFHMMTWGNVWSLFVLVSVGTATFSVLGLVVASVANSVQETQVINNVVWTCFLFLSGATIPLPILPGWIQHFALYLPATYLVTGLQGAMLDGIGRGELLEDALALTVTLVAAFEVSRRLFRWEPEEKIAGKAKVWVVAVMIPFIVLGAWESRRGQRLGEFRGFYQDLSKPLTPFPDTVIPRQ